MLLQVLVRAKPATIEMLQNILAPGNSSAFAPEDVGAWLTLDISGPEEIFVAIEELRDSLDLAAGAMSLWANCRDRPSVTNLQYRDPETGSQKGMLLDAYSVVAPLTPDAILDVTDGSLPRGAAVVGLAQKNPAVARALSVSVAGASQWWELYVLLEILRDSLGSREDWKNGSWKRLFEVLAARYRVSVKSLEDLRQTINYHRHFHSAFPARPWEHRDAVEFVRTAVREWIDDLVLENE